MATIAATVTNAGLNLLGKAAMGTDVATIKYVALGTGSNAPSASDTQLQAESSVTGSRAAATVSVGTNPGEVTVSATFQTTDAIGVNIAEVGFFAGNTATTSANSGVLFARALWSHSGKLNTETITISLDLTY